MKHKILIVDDQPNILKLLDYNVKKLGYDVITAKNGLECLELVEKQHFSAVMLDITMPDMDGIETLQEIKEIDKNLPVIMVTALDEISIAVKAIKEGAYEYMTKPIDFDKLKVELKNAIEIHSLKHQVSSLKHKLNESNLFTNIIGKSNELQGVFDIASKVVNSDVSVLIIGESGTGKEMLAQAIHKGSDRSSKTFVPVNSAAINRELSDSLLFGHKKGSFTGANEDRIGYFEQADGGTLFLDEIGDMDLDIQAKVLRVLENKTIRRVGEKIERKVDFRIITATNRDLADFIRENKFRKDLYYRLEEYPIYIPPLRSRKDDIILLAEHFLKDYCESNNIELMTFSKDVEKLLKNHLWPGNIRELKNVVRRSALRFSGNVIENISFSNIQAIEGNIKDNTYTENISSGEIVPFAQIEKKAIEQAYNATNQNAIEASRLLGISRATIYRKLKQFDIE